MSSASALRPLESGVLVDRLIATLVAAALVISANLIADKALGKVGSPPAAPAAPDKTARRS
jgi:hypothetical protein